ncbi:hypothetical protein CHUAL_002136 [Chamberlinius hualienensis]
MGTYFPKKLILDGSVTLIGAGVILCTYFGIISPRHHGFYCNDPKLDFTYNGDSLTLGTLIAIVTIVPLVFIFAVEFGRHHPFRSISKLKNPPENHRNVFWKCCLLVFRTYLNGLLCAIVIVEVLKIAVGGLRPHFFDSCQPDYTKINCSDGFITEYRCTKELNPWHHSDIFKSFPSGHAALSMYMSLFLCFYLHKQLVLWPTGYICSLVQALLIIFAVQCGCSRMMDHRHHWWDVLIGGIIGTLTCFHSAYWLCKITPLCDTILPLPKTNWWPRYEKPKRKSDREQFSPATNNQEDPFFSSSAQVTSKLNLEETNIKPKIDNISNHYKQDNLAT